jgi:hypothetical protein
VEASQGVELTGTNRPSGLASTFFVCFASTVRFPRCGRYRTGPGLRSWPVRSSHLHSVSVAMAKGKHPVPFRTRKLSPSAPMVLRGGPRGRVGRRRTSSVEAAPSRERPQLRCPGLAASGPAVGRLVWGQGSGATDQSSVALGYRPERRKASRCRAVSGHQERVEQQRGRRAGSGWPGP